MGVARIDITPDYPVRLSGFGFRRAESEGATQKIWAKALAFGGGDQLAILITVDNLGLPGSQVDEVARRLKEKIGLEATRLAVTATHTHTAPMLRGVAPTLFGMPIPEDHQKRIDRYSRELTDRLVEVAVRAAADRRKASVSWGRGRVDFAINRRTKGGPVDHDLPVLVVRDSAGTPRAIWTSYACHCVTLSDNKVSGDWAGFAQEHIEKRFPGAIALLSVGCGGDQNPSSGVTGGRSEVASEQGESIAKEIARVLQGELAPLDRAPTIRHERIRLSLDEPPSRERWKELAAKDGAVGHHARVNLARLDRGEKLTTEIDYPIQTWAFGDRLAVVFLPGEVVVDYALRLKRELDSRRLWINAYSNHSPCYIPSERILKEGGYEGGGAMIYYDLPTRLASGLEKKIVKTVHGQIGREFGIRDQSQSQSQSSDLRVRISESEL